MQILLAIGSGSLVGFTLGLIGGGGSILAVPLLVYVVGVADPHLAIGTSALAVAMNAFANVWPHARAGNVQWKPATIFAAAGIIGAYGGSTLGKAVDGQRLLALFAMLMLVIAVLMQRRRSPVSQTDARLPPGTVARLAGVGLGAGMLSGFFGIGGGFLIVPGLILAANLSTLHAVGSSLVAVGAFGLTTAVNYALSGLVDWRTAALFIAGGVAGGWAGTVLAHQLSQGRDRLNRVFGAVLVVVALYMLAHSAGWVPTR